ncbi:MAG: ribosome maturation factor RimP [Thermoleophilaceae bacterium]|jgi:ribosome maturation factor RimP|nr:ribosome maturation factor RimP [Thermoleophilaceae bacterium]
MQVSERDIQERLKGSEPEVEVLLVEQTGAGRLRLFIDHPKGVDLGLCERVTRNLGDLLETYTVEVSSPGPARPLVKPEHFRRFVGRRIKVRTKQEHEGRHSFTGELVGASDDAVTVAADDGIVSLPYGDINRSNLVEE